MSLTPEERAARAIYEKARRRENRERRQTIKAARKPGGKADRGRERDTGYLAFLRRLPCACGCGASAPSDAAHVRMPDLARCKPYTGKGVKPSDKWALPLNRRCHEEQHSGSEAAFWAGRGIDAVGLCLRLYEVAGDEVAALKIIRPTAPCRAPGDA